jgi:hypothetical protein
MNLQFQFIFLRWVFSMQHTFPAVNKDFYMQFKVNAQQVASNDSLQKHHYYYSKQLNPVLG